MQKDKIWLSSPHMGGNEQKYVSEAFATNWIAPLGPNVVGFEKDLENYLDNESHVAVLSSGTAALHLGLLQLGVGAMDEIVCQSFTFVASVAPILYLGAIPIFVDSEEETWNICPVALEHAILDRLSKGKKPKAIVAVHLYGMPFNVDAVLAISKKYDIPVLEDSAEALGSTYKGKKCGTFGTVSVLSFNGNKIITTSGGGALVTPSKTIKEHTVFLATQAKDNAPHYEHSQMGYNYRMSNVCAGIGRGQMEVLDRFVAKRRAIHQFYLSVFESVAGVVVFKAPNHDYFSNHWLTTILLDSFETREALRFAFEEEHIETRPLWKPMHLQPLFKDCSYYGSAVASQLFERGLCLPSGSNLTTMDKERIFAVIKKFF